MDRQNNNPAIKKNKLAKRHSALVTFSIRLFREQLIGTLCAIIIIVLVLIGIFANFLAPHGIDEMDLMNRLSSPSFQHPLGTDQIGRDELSRIIYGARITMSVAIGATGMATIISILIGMFSGFIGGKFDIIVQRFVDAWMSFPSILILMTIMSLLGKGLIQIILVLGVLFGIGSSRIIRGAVIGIKENTYVSAASSIGSSTWKTMIRHILPNIMPQVMITSSVSIGSIILTEATLSFLGFGVPVGTPSWGSMLSWDGRMYMQQAPALAIWPGLALTLAVFSFNMFGDAVRDILDPRLKGGVGSYTLGKKLLKAKIKLYKI